VPVDFSPVLRIDASPRKVGQVLWHPAARHVLASGVGDHTVKLWDLGAPETPRAVLAGHTDTIQSLAFSSTGQLLVTTSRDRKLRVFDPRTGGEPVRVGEGHGGIKGARVVWMGDRDRVATTEQMQLYLDHLPNARLVTLEGHGHRLMDTAPAEAAAAINTFLHDVLSFDGRVPTERTPWTSS
jgi:WD40 repeat protein